MKYNPDGFSSFVNVKYTYKSYSLIPGGRKYDMS